MSCVGQPDGQISLRSSTGVTYTASCFNGYALLAKLDGRKNTWYYDSPLWTSTTTLNPTSFDLDMAEAKLRGIPVDPAHMRDAISGLYNQPGGDRIDAVVLACTHFPLLAEEIQSASPHPVALVESGEGIARRTTHLTTGQDWTDKPTSLAVLTRKDDASQKLSDTFQRSGLGRTEYL
jgi:hypothetical protein